MRLIELYLKEHYKVKIMEDNLKINNMKNRQLEREVSHSDGPIDTIKSLIEDLVREIEDLEFDKNRLQDRIDELELSEENYKDLVSDLNKQLHEAQTT